MSAFFVYHVDHVVIIILLHPMKTPLWDQDLTIFDCGSSCGKSFPGDSVYYFSVIITWKLVIALKVMILADSFFFCLAWKGAVRHLPMFLSTAYTWLSYHF